MSRKTLMTLHLYLAAFFAPILLLMAVSGGLYLAGIKGEMRKGEPVFLQGAAVQGEGDVKVEGVKALLEQAGMDSDFEYLKDRGNLLETRPTSRDYVVVVPKPDGVELTPVSPSLVAAMMELHMGHGPGLYRILQQIMAMGLVLVLITGLWLGLQSPLLKNKTIAVSAAGIVVFVIFAAF